MKIRVKDILDAGLHVQRTLSPEEIALTEADCRFRSPLAVQAHVQKAVDEVIADVKVDGIYEYECARCLDPVSFSRHDVFEIYFDITPQTEFVDLGEEIRQELLLVLTFIPLCRDDCKGICTRCGLNLNKEKCKCKALPQESRGINI